MRLSCRYETDISAAEIQAQIIRDSRFFFGAPLGVQPAVRSRYAASGWLHKGRGSQGKRVRSRFEAQWSWIKKDPGPFYGRVFF